MIQRITGDILPVSNDASLEISVICPFFNEEGIIADAIQTLLGHLRQNLEADWELIIINDGSTDCSGDIASQIAAENPRLRVLGYQNNRGRGHALRAGIAQARGRIIITTEIDLSWGEDIIEKLYKAIEKRPDADIVIASPHLPEGGYKNVPAKRVFLSRFGNLIIRSFMSNVATMNTGMTRAYRRDAIRSLPLDEDGKEFHLEVVLKARALNYRFFEIPALLEWKNYKHQGRKVTRKSSSKVNKLVLSHSLFSLFANPIRYVWGLSGAVFLLALGLLMWGVVRFFSGEVSVFVLLVSLALFIVSLLLFAFGVIAQQGNMIQREIWQLKRDFLISEHNAIVSKPGDEKDARLAHPAPSERHSEFETRTRS